MTDNTKFDLAQRVAQAFSGEAEPKMSGGCEFDPDMHVPLGEVPRHLRGLGALANELLEEAAKAKRSARTAEENFMTVHNLFCKALQSYIPTSGERPPVAGLILYDDWKIAGIRRQSVEEIIDEVLERKGESAE